MMKKFKVLGSVLYKQIYPFENLCESSIELESVEDVLKCDAIVLWGGIDINPSIYKEPMHPKNQLTKSGFYYSIPLSKRDVLEVEIIRKAIENNIPIIGVCRGAQLLCAVDGGKLIQDLPVRQIGLVSEVCITEGVQVIEGVPVDHHQAMVLNPDNNNIVLGWNYQHLPYTVFFPKFKALGFQGHPEWVDSHNHPYVKWVYKCIEKYL